MNRLILVLASIAHLQFSGALHPDVHPPLHGLAQIA
jgi:hypothetical protein